MKHSTITRIAAAALSVITVVAIAACSSSSGGSGAPNNEGGSAAPGDGGAASTVLTIQGDAGNPTLVENFNPLVSQELHGTYLIYEPLEFRSPIDGSFTPFLATGHKFTNSKTVVFTIRQGVKWSDGTPFTADDVVFTFDLLKKYPALDGTGIWQQVSSVTNSGNDVTVTFKHPNVPFAGVVAQTPIVPKHIWSTVSDPVKYANTKPIGTGPYTLAEFAPTEYTLAKNTTYWQGDKIVPTKVVFPAESSNQSTNQLDVTSGKFDWAYNYLPDVKATFVARDPQHNVYWFPPGGIIGLYLNLTKAPYNNVDFRKGVARALDRKTIATKAVNGYLGPASQSGIILPNEKKWLDPSLSGQGVISQDTAAATADFTEAGYTLKGGKLVGSNGQQVSMSIVMPGNFSDWVAAATEISNELGKVGITVKMDLPQYAQYSQAIQSGSFDAAMGGFGGSGDPYTDFNNALNSSFATPKGTPTANNFQRFNDPAADQALAALAGATDQATQQQDTYKLEQIMVNQMPIVLLYYGGSWGLFSTKNFAGWPSAQDPYTLPTNYNNSLLIVLTHLKKA